MISRLEKWDRIFIIAFLVLIGLHLAMFLSLRILPFVDLPNHLAAATIVKNYDDSQNDFEQFFESDPNLRPNTFHLFLCSLDIFPSVEFGNKVFYALYIILLPLSVLFLIRKAGGDPWLSLLSFLMLYNYNVLWGFVGFTMALPLIFFMLGFMLDLFNKFSLKTVLILGLMFPALFFVHGIAALFALLAFAVLTFLNCGKSLQKISLSALAILPYLALHIGWYSIRSEGYGFSQITSYLSKYYSAQYLAEFANRFNVILFDNYYVFEGVNGDITALLFALALMTPFLWQIFSARQAFLDQMKDRRMRTVFFFSAIALSCAFILPKDVLYDPTLLYQRIAVFFMISVLVLGSHWRLVRKKMPLKIAIILICLTHFGLWTEYFNGFQKENESFTAGVLRQDGYAQPMAYLPADPFYRGLPSYIHFQNYRIVWNQGIASTSLIDYVFGAVKRKAPKEILPPHTPWISRMGYTGQYDEMNYLLIRGNPGVQLKRHLLHSKGFELLKLEGEWALLGKPHQNQ
ncbi:MAG: hypothetical protein GF310_12950 [candidate division Zixibacteria bacterium]|nr:hypothetical protein [candidate division Zixibacteria bacterium]